MKYRRTTAVIIGPIAIVALIAYSLLGEHVLAPDSTLPETESAETTANIQNTKVRQNLKKQVSSQTAIQDDQHTSAYFIINPDVSALWPVSQDKESVVVQRHNLISAWKIALDRHLIDDLQPGEQLNLSIPQTSRSLTITLNTIKSGRYSQSKIASIDGGGGAYSAYFTLGAETLYGSIETPEGVFHIEQNSTGEAMIYAASEIRENLDYSVSDAVLVLPPLDDGR